MHGRGPIGVYVNKIELCVKKKKKERKCTGTVGNDLYMYDEMIWQDGCTSTYSLLVKVSDVCASPERAGSLACTSIGMMAQT